MPRLQKRGSLARNGNSIRVVRNEWEGWSSFPPRTDCTCAFNCTYEMCIRYLSNGYCTVSFPLKASPEANIFFKNGNNFTCHRHITQPQVFISAEPSKFPACRWRKRRRKEVGRERGNRKEGEKGKRNEMTRLSSAVDIPEKSRS